MRGGFARPWTTTLGILRIPGGCDAGPNRRRRGPPHCGATAILTTLHPTSGTLILYTRFCLTKTKTRTSVLPFAQSPLNSNTNLQ
ncbi:hypothetical protein EKL94_16850, partial [Stenotrophomonas maltophilia]